jgi:hypothetical protein
MHQRLSSTARTRKTATLGVLALGPLLLLGSCGSLVKLRSHPGDPLPGLSYEAPLGTLVGVHGLTDGREQGVLLRVAPVLARAGKEGPALFQARVFQDANGNLQVDPDEPQALVQEFDTQLAAFTVQGFEVLLPPNLEGPHLAIRLELWAPDGKLIVSTASLIGATRPTADAGQPSR